MTKPTSWLIRRPISTTGPSFCCGCWDEAVGEHDDELVVDDRVFGDNDDSDTLLLPPLLLLLPLLLTPLLDTLLIATVAPLPVGERTTSGSCASVPIELSLVVAVVVVTRSGDVTLVISLLAVVVVDVVLLVVVVVAAVLLAYEVTVVANLDG